MKKTLLLSDHRTGSTCIKDYINQSSEIKFLTLEPLFWWQKYDTTLMKNYLREEFDKQPPSLHNIEIERLFKHFDLLHIHRQHLDTAHERDLAWLSNKDNLNIIDIKRWNIRNQFISYRLALESGVWRGEREDKVYELKINDEMYSKFKERILDVRNRYDLFFKNHKRIEILYENFEDSEEDLKNILNEVCDLIGIKNEGLEIRRKPSRSRIKLILT